MQIFILYHIYLFISHLNQAGYYPVEVSDLFIFFPFVALLSTYVS